MSTVLVDYLKEQLRRRGWSGRSFADHAQVSNDTVSRTLRGESVPEPESIRKFAKALSVDESYLLRLAGHLEEIPSGLKNPKVVALAQRIEALPPHVIDEALSVLEAQVDTIYQISGMVAPAEFKAIPPAPPNNSLDPAAIVEGLVRLAQENPAALLQLMTQLQSGQLGKESGGG